MEVGIFSRFLLPLRTFRPLWFPGKTTQKFTAFFPVFVAYPEGKALLLFRARQRTASMRKMVVSLC